MQHADVQTLFPFNEDYVTSTLMTAPGPPAHSRLPCVELLSREALGDGKERLTLQPHLPGPGYFGSMNVTGRVLEWSFPRTETASQNMVSSLLSVSEPVIFIGGKKGEHNAGRGHLF